MVFMMKCTFIILFSILTTILIGGSNADRPFKDLAFNQTRRTDRSNLRTTDYQFKSAKFSRTSEYSPRHDLRTRWYTTRLDHFNPLDQRTLNFSYIDHLDYYQPGGPIFIYINDGGIFTTEFLEVGLMHDIAIEAGAALVTGNNRYFRSNLPTEDASTPNLEYLTVDQTIQDIARMIHAVRLDLSATSSTRVILWGSGLGGTLATWTRQKYPNLVDGVWSSSGIFGQPVVTSGIYESLSESIAAVGGQECADNVLEAFEDLETLISYGFAGEIEAYFTFNICFIPWFDWDLDIGSFFAGLTQLLIDYINRHHYHGIQNFCADMNRTDVYKYQAFGDWINYAFTDEMCIDVFFLSRVIEAWLDSWSHISSIAWEGIINIVYPFPSRPLYYLQCTQLGMFSTNVNAQTLFGRQVGQDLHFWGCWEVFEDNYDYFNLQTALETLNIQYGGRNPGISNAIYTNGLLDPNHQFGILDQNLIQPANSYVANIHWYGKSADLFSLSENDSEELRAIKLEIWQLVLEWSNVL